MATARIQMTVEIDVPDTWGPDCTLAQVQKQAVDSAQVALLNGLRFDRTQIGRDPKTFARFVGMPLVVAVLVMNAPLDTTPAPPAEGGGDE